jgi:hypothetical protein
MRNDGGLRRKGDKVKSKLLQAHKGEGTYALIFDKGDDFASARQVMTRLLRRLTLPYLLRLLVTLSIPPLWLEIALLHFRGSFHSSYMWVPILSLPAVLVGGVISMLVGDEQQARRLFRPLAWLMTLVGTAGTFFHLRGIGRQMGGFYNWKYNVSTGPPFPAPPQVAIVGSLGILASTRPSAQNTRRLVRWLNLADVLGYTLFAIEVGYNHWWGSFFNPVMYLPVLLAPLLALIHLFSLFGRRTARTIQLFLSLVAALVGLAGFFFHLYNLLRRRQGFLDRDRRVRWQSLFYGPPTMAPLQLVAQGAIGLLAALFDERP